MKSFKKFDRKDFFKQGFIAVIGGFFIAASLKNSPVFHTIGLVLIRIGVILFLFGIFKKKKKDGN